MTDIMPGSLMKPVYVDHNIDDLTLWEDNPRTIKKTDFERLIKQIKQLGVYKPLLINQDNIILGGNMRYRALKEIGITEVSCSLVKTDNKAQMMDYALSDNDQIGVTDEQALAEYITLNPGVKSELFAINSSPMKLVSTMLQEISPEVEEDEAPPVADVAISKLGEIYQLGDHRLMCGDSINSEQVAQLMDGKEADMVFTDPPYNVDYGSSKNPRHKIRKIEGDNLTENDWAEFNVQLANILKANCTGDIYIWGAPGPDGMRQRLTFVELGAHWSATIIWKKQQLVLSPAKYQRMYEPCFYGWFDRSSFGTDRTQTEVWEVDRPHDSKEHPTMKPIALCAKGIANSSRKKGAVLDLFGGSGSTLIACEQIDRTCYMMELDPIYTDVIRKRYAKLKDPEKWEESWQTLTPSL